MKLNLDNLIAHWKTTSAGLVMISGGVIHLVFQIRAHTADENAWTIAIGATLGGLGLIFAADSNTDQNQ